MGQELLALPDSIYRQRKRTFYVATSSKGYKVLRGSSNRRFTHAVVVIEPSEEYGNGYIWGSFSTKEKYIKSRAQKNYSEVVETKEITAKEYRQLKKEIDKVAQEWREKRAQRLANIYQINREAE